MKFVPRKIGQMAGKIPIHKPREEYSTPWNEMTRLFKLSLMLTQNCQLQKKALGDCSASAKKKEKFKTSGCQVAHCLTLEEKMAIIAIELLQEAQSFDSQYCHGDLSMNFLQISQK